MSDRRPDLPASAVPPTSSADLVDSLLHPLAVQIRQLLDRSQRQALDRLLIDDEENIQRALEAGVALQSVFHSGDESLSHEFRRQLPPGVAIHEVARRTCKKLFENEKVSRVFAIARAPQPRSLDSLAAVPRDIVVLEDLTIAGNIGAIVRTSCALGVGGIVLVSAQPFDVYDRRLIRASRGHVFSLPIVTATAQALLGFCSRFGVHLLVTAPCATSTVGDIVALPQRLAIVFGSEKAGCSPELTSAAALRVRIPTSPKVESLNVSAAAGIALYNRLEFNGVAAG